jgi:ureidoglycolate dehydrogenase (NAD+)
VKRVSAEELDRLMRRALLRRGVAEEHAGWVAESLVQTSLRGIDTHGVRLFPTYLSELDGGRSVAQPHMRWLGEARAARVLDAGNALGLVAGRAASGEAVRLARENGIGAVAVRSSNHFGAASVYTLEMARQGLLGLAFSNSDALVAPFHGQRPVFGTNPISLAVGGQGDDLFCADFATSQTSYSKVRHRRQQGLPLEPGWAGEGDVLLPLGAGSGHKGQCLGMMVEILCAVLAGMPLDHELSHLFDAPWNEPRQVSHLFLAFDLAAFREPGAVRADLSRLMRIVRDQPAAPGERVLVPGDPEAEVAAERLRQGIPLTEEEAAAFERIELEDQGAR